jgi:hypothetical protein
MREIVIDHPANEASGLLAIENRAVLEAHGWDLGFWTCADEDPIQEALGALGRPAGSPDGWEYCRLANVHATGSKKTEDAEAMARRGGIVYIFGSHFGPKPGPLRSRRQFVARFDESSLHGRLDETPIELEIARGRFKLHRLVNDALRDSGLELIGQGKKEAKRYVRDVLERGKDKGKRWAARVDKHDRPVNIEGVAFRPSGNLLLGLRYPVTRDGHPLLVEVEGIERLFEDGASRPEVRAVWVLADLGSAEEPRGVRALEELGDAIHVITGNLDSDLEESVVLQDHPEGERARSRHHRVLLPEPGDTADISEVRAEPVGDLGDEAKVEGLAIDGEGNFCYVMDDDRIRLRCAPPRR